MFYVAELGAHAQGSQIEFSSRFGRLSGFSWGVVPATVPNNMSAEMIRKSKEKFCWVFAEKILPQRVSNLLNDELMCVFHRELVDRRGQMPTVLAIKVISKRLRALPCWQDAN